ncbi:hypothetical protein GOV04_02085 [Candidatus Woesearchaeota archaeon]|nr:hypothetical protein [Candidatus Woesearchaeota archaeon]
MRPRLFEVTLVMLTMLILLGIVSYKVFEFENYQAIEVLEQKTKIISAQASFSKYDKNLKVYEDIVFGLLNDYNKDLKDDAVKVAWWTEKLEGLETSLVELDSRKILFERNHPDYQTLLPEYAKRTTELFIALERLVVIELEGRKVLPPGFFESKLSREIAWSYQFITDYTMMLQEKS